MSELDRLTSILALATPVATIGRVQAIRVGRLSISGLQACVRLDDRVIVEGNDGLATARVVEVVREMVDVRLDGPADVSLDARVRHAVRPRLEVGDALRGRIIDPEGSPLDGRSLLPSGEAPSPDPLRRKKGGWVRTGLGYFDLVDPVHLGERVAVHAVDSCGEITLLGQLLQHGDFGIAVVSGTPERPGLATLENRLGKASMGRAVFVIDPDGSAQRARASADRIVDDFVARGVSVCSIAFLDDEGLVGAAGAASQNQRVAQFSIFNPDAVDQGRHRRHEAIFDKVVAMTERAARSGLRPPFDPLWSDAGVEDTAGRARRHIAERLAEGDPDLRAIAKLLSQPLRNGGAVRDAALIELEALVGDSASN